MTQHQIAHAIDTAFAHGMFQVTSEIRAFVEWIAALGLDGPAIEIGTHRGGTAVLWCELGFDPVISVDLATGPWGGIGVASAVERDRLLRTRYPAYRHIEGDSHEQQTIDHVEIVLPTHASLLFIDGDHSRAGVEADYRNYERFVRSGGVVAFHDIADTPLHRERGVEVADFWGALLGGQRHEFVQAGHEWGGIGAVVKP